MPLLSFSNPAPKQLFRFAYLVGLMSVVLQPFRSPALDVLVSFNITNGAAPYAGLLKASDGNFYGTTSSGGKGNQGTVFRLSPEGGFTNLVAFNNTNGATPFADLVEGNDGNFYGTTFAGGSGEGGTVYKVTPSGTLTTLASMSFPVTTEGYFPYSRLLLGIDNNFYGTTYEGGGTNRYGTVFKITPAGIFTRIASLVTSSNGYYPRGGLAQDAEGNLYGVAEQGGSLNRGTVFKVATNGTLTRSALFIGEGSNPVATLTKGDDNHFYGCAVRGGISDRGTIFKVTTNGTLTRLFSFSHMDGAYPYAQLLKASDGNFYGTTQAGGLHNRGTVFRMTPAGVLTSLYSFNVASGTSPHSSLVEGNDGNLYGTTSEFGPGGVGTVFRLFTTLSSARSGNDIVLSWPTNSVGVRLQSTSELTSPSVWTDITNAPVVVGNQFTTTQPIDNDQKFFRLKQ